MESVSVIRAADVACAVRDLYCRVARELRPDVVAALSRALEEETSPLARDVLRVLLENERISRAEGVPLCQDTGLGVAFVSLGNRVVIEGGTLQEAVDDGIRAAAAEVPLRASTVEHPLTREPRGDNTPGIVHVEHVAGDELTISLLAKGGGGENMSRLQMLTPAEGREGVLRVITEAVSDAGANACPPLIVGVGLGGDFERAAVLAKRSLLRDIRERNPDPALDELEREALKRVNALGIGPQGFGGRTTALAVVAEAEPCHIAALPVAVNLECHSHRHGSVTLRGDPQRPAGD